MSIAKFLECWGTSGASVFLRMLVDMPERLQKPDVHAQVNKLANDLELALLEYASEELRGVQTERLLHQCKGRTPEDDSFNSHGAAIVTCGETHEGKLFVDNGEYSSQVSFCPYCGYKAKVPAKI